MKDLGPIIGHNLAELRKARGLTQLQVAEHFHYTDKSVSKWEHGDVLPDIEVLSELSDFYGVTVDFLIQEQAFDTLKSYGERDQEKIKTNQIIITVLAVVLVWTLASIVYVGATIFEASWHGWLAFIWAIPGSFMALNYTSKKYWGSRFRLPLLIAIGWTLNLATYLELTFDLENGYNLWFIFFLGIPWTICVILIERQKSLKKLKSVNENKDVLEDNSSLPD